MTKQEKIQTAKTKQNLEQDDEDSWEPYDFDSPFERKLDIFSYVFGAAALAVAVAGLLFLIVRQWMGKL